MELNQIFLQTLIIVGDYFSILDSIKWLYIYSLHRFRSLIYSPPPLHLLTAQGRAGILISFMLAILPGSLRGITITSEIINVTHVTI